MPSCQRVTALLLLTTFALFLSTSTSFVIIKQNTGRAPFFRMALQPEETTVQVCGFKDCKRAGGGPRLEKLVKEVRIVVMNVFMC